MRWYQSWHWQVYEPLRLTQLEWSPQTSGHKTHSLRSTSQLPPVQPSFRHEEQPELTSHTVLSAHWQYSSQFTPQRSVGHPSIFTTCDCYQSKPKCYTGWLKKVRCYTLVDNFGKYGPFSIILSLLQSVMNCGKSHLKYVAALPCESWKFNSTTTE